MPTKSIQTDVLEIAYLDEGPAGGPVVFLLHGWPDDVRAWQQVAPCLHEAGLRTITPYLRGFGGTRFLSAGTIRDGRGVALAQDAIDLADALNIDTFYVAGHDWGGRAAYQLAALFPGRIKKIASMALPFQPRGAFSIPPFDQARLFWYQWLMCMEDGAEAVRKDPVGFARIQWDTWGPAGWYEEDDFVTTAESFTNPDWAAITLHGYRSRFLPETNDPRYDGLQQQMTAIDQLRVPALVIVGAADTCDPLIASENMEHCFTAGYQRMVLEGIGHFPLREAPLAVGDALVKHFV